MATAVDNSTPGLERAWYAVSLSSEVGEQPRRVEVLGRAWVVLRMQGELVAFADRCPHRLAPLSIGSAADGLLQCRYHGWQFDAGGGCVHIPALGGDATIPPRACLDIPTQHVEHEGWVASTTYEVLYRNHDDPLVATGEHPLVQPQLLYKECRPATTSLVRLQFPLTGNTLTILFSCLPVNAEETIVFKMMARDDFSGDEMKESLAFEDLVLDEDLDVLESYPDRALPIDLRTEVHTCVDRLSATYRRILADLVGATVT